MVRGGVATASTVTWGDVSSAGSYVVLAGDEDPSVALGSQSLQSHKPKWCGKYLYRFSIAV